MNLLNLSADAIKQNELEIYKATSDGNREMLRSLKIRQLSLEKKFRMDFESLNHQMASFEEKQKTLLQSLIGEEGAQNILQSFKAHILEDISHIQADVSTLEQLIINEDVESVSSVLEGTPMAIVMWSRNPNEDLYLGNYTDCCIRIDSAHMGEESTIADYLTDLGMQVITVRDEKRDVPVVAAWSFIGENQETGEVALVIDNIEADTNYSLAYASQLSSRLKRYFENLAKSIGVKKIVQGMDNNDLTIFKMDGRYAKLGGYNREGGYFLEGEHSDNVYDEEVEDE
jgi:hypothetical protein